jgi:predicted amidophosphoribosyltransferase
VNITKCVVNFENESAPFPIGPNEREKENGESSYRDAIIIKIQIDNKEQDITYKFYLLPSNVDHKTGRRDGHSNSNYSNNRKNRLSSATDVWQVGYYIPSKYENAKNDHLTQQILKNKEHCRPHILAIGMYSLATKKKFPIFDVDIIAPIPNFEKSPFKNNKAVSIARYLTLAMQKNGHNRVVFKENLLRKTMNVTTKHMHPAEKESFYAKNQLYEFNENSGNISGKKILLIDDVVTQGFTAEQCLNELAKNNPSALYFYAAGTTKI